MQNAIVLLLYRLQQLLAKVLGRRKVLAATQGVQQLAVPVLR